LEIRVRKICARGSKSAQSLRALKNATHCKFVLYVRASKLLSMDRISNSIMISSPKFTVRAGSFFRRGLVLGFFPLLAAGAFSGSLVAQDATPPAGGANAASPDTGNGRGRRGNFSPEAMMNMLRTRFGVTDDAEWAIISARITPVIELRRSTMGGFRMGGFGGGGGRGGAGNPELDALRSAVTDNMPDAEIKARLERLREVRKEDQEKLEKAQADLVSVLTVKQEAVAVMMGLVP
jgi:hypothetical protein